MKLSFFGADKTVTGSCHCLEVGGKRILIDCGLQQGAGDKDNSTLPFAPGSIDYVLVTHAHIDHSGRLPLLVKQGYSGPIITTRLTAQLLSIMTARISMKATPPGKIKKAAGPGGIWWSRYIPCQMPKALWRY